MEYDKEYIGQLIQKARKENNLKQSQLAEKIGISEKHLSKIETGKNFPALNNFLKMIEVLGISFNYFGVTESYRRSELKDKMQKIINTSSDKQLKIYLDVIASLKNHF